MCYENQLAQNMTTFKRSEYPDIAAFILSLRNDEPKIDAKIAEFKRDPCSTCDDESTVRIGARLFCTPCAYHHAN